MVTVMREGLSNGGGWGGEGRGWGHSSMVTVMREGLSNGGGLGGRAGGGGGGGNYVHVVRGRSGHQSWATTLMEI